MGLNIDLLAWLKKVAYIKSEVDTFLNGKSDTGHTHDDRYYTETEIDGKVTTINESIATKAESNHNHDDRYYTESEIDTKLNGKSDTGHTHLSSEVFTDNAHTTSVASEISSIKSDIAALQNADWDIKIVSDLPATGVAGALYFVTNGESGDNQYTEYVYDAKNERFELIGERTIDLSGYVQIANCGLSLTDSGILTLSVS